MLRAGPLMTMLRALAAVAFAESLTWTVKLPVPGVAGVPAMVPVGSRESPAGRAPVVIDHWLPPAPPVAVRV